MPRKPPRSTEERLVRAQKSMMPGTLGGRVASAAPMSLDVTRLDPRLRASPASAVTGGGWNPDVDPVVIGHDAMADESGSVSIGLTARAPGSSWFHSGCTDNIAIGQLTQSGGNRNNDKQNTAVGYNANAYDGYGTAVGSQALAQAGRSVAVGVSSHGGGVSSVAVGDSAQAGGDLSIAIGHDVNTPAYTTAVGGDAITPGTECTVLGYGANSGAYSDANYNTVVGAWSGVDVGGGHLQFCTAIGHSSKVVGQQGTAIGAAAVASYAYSVAIGAYASTTVDHQIMLGTDAEFVEIPGNGAANGLVLTDTADGTRYLVQITSGALVLGTAP